MKKVLLGLIGVGVLALNGEACGIEGYVTWSDGSKSDGTSTISTSWNSKKAYPRNGYYQLDLGSSVCGERITVYVNGNQGKKVKVSGNTQVNFTLR
ncbi:MAG: hypothetical protein U9N49_04745 [Campylobacterota bacterium]|nr:hypothetical protein [Campylobacterota bacterium]